MTRLDHSATGEPPEEKPKPGDDAPQTMAYAWYVVIVLTLASTMSFVDRQILALMIGPIERDLHVSDTMMGLLGGLAFMLFDTILVLPMAWFADRYSRRKIISLGILAWSIMTTLCGAAFRYYQLFLARVGVGVGDAMMSPAAISMLSDYFPKQRLPLAMGTLLAAPFIGVGLANIMGGWVVQYLERMPPVHVPILGLVHSWQFTFIIVGLPGLVLAAAFFLSVLEPRRGDRLYDTLEDIPLAVILRFVRDRKSFLIPQFAAYILLSIQGWALFYWVAEFFIRDHGMSRAAIGEIYGTMALTLGIAGSILSGYIASRAQAQGRIDSTMRLVVIAAACLTPIAIAMPLVSSTALAFALLVPITFFMAWPGGLGITALQFIVPNELRARIIGLYLLVVNFVSYSLGPLLGGFINDHVFGGYHSLGKTLALMSAVDYPLAAICILLSLKPFRQAMASATQWSGAQSPFSETSVSEPDATVASGNLV